MFLIKQYRGTYHFFGDGMKPCTFTLSCFTYLVHLFVEELSGQRAGVFVHDMLCERGMGTLNSPLGLQNTFERVTIRTTMGVQAADVDFSPENSQLIR